MPRQTYSSSTSGDVLTIRAARALSGGIVWVSPHDPRWFFAPPTPRTSSSALGDRITATGRPWLTISTQPSAATPSRSPPKLFSARLRYPLHVLAI